MNQEATRDWLNAERPLIPIIAANRVEQVPRGVNSLPSRRRDDVASQTVCPRNDKRPPSRWRPTPNHPRKRRIVKGETPVDLVQVF